MCERVFITEKQDEEEELTDVWTEEGEKKVNIQEKTKEETLDKWDKNVPDRFIKRDTYST